jgi:NAD(P)H-hydrate epimerase
MARLLACSTKDVQARRVELAINTAAKLNATIVLKGHHTVIAAPDGRVYINSTGNPGMGTAGTGDVLTGMLAGLTAQFGANAWTSILAFGVYLHGLAGDIAFEEVGQAPLMASDLIRAIPRAYQRFHAELLRE